MGIVYEGVLKDGEIILQFVDWLKLKELDNKNWLQKLLTNFNRN